MEIFGFEKLSLVDYDGKVAATLFTSTCNFRCGFCHNAPLVTGTNSLTAIPNEDIFALLKKRQGILEGVCITGGEPTLQKDLPEFIEQIKNLGYSVKLDTNGTNPKMVKTLYENGLVDYFAIDVKNDKDNYGEIIGINNYDVRKVNETVEYLINNVSDYEFRTTLIKQYHKDENILKIGEWIKGAKNYRLQKFTATENCISTGLDGVNEDMAKHFLTLVSPFVQNAKLRGY